jgi:hypothetical protein
MTIRFPYEDEALEDQEEALVVDSDEDEDEVSATGTEVSASEFAGTLTKAPTKMYFGARECGVIFTLPSDQGLFSRVCGCSVSSCKRAGHSTLMLTEEGRGRDGWYDTVISRKFVDGKLGTHVSREVYVQQLAKETDRRYKEIEKVGAQWEGKSPSPGDSSYEEVEAEIEAAGIRTRAQRGTERSNPFGFFSPKARESNSPAADAKSLTEVKNRIGNFFRGANDKDPKEGMVVELMEDEDDKSSEAMIGMMSIMAQQMKELQGELNVMRAESKKAAKVPAMASSLKVPSTKTSVSTKMKKSAPGVGKTKGGTFAGTSLVQQALGTIAPLGNAKTRGAMKPPPNANSGGAPTGWWYAVAKGKEGASGIYDSWAEASVMVNGVSGAIYRKFREYEDAWDFVQRYLDSVDASRNSGTTPKVIKEDDEDAMKEEERHKRAAAELALQVPIECKTAPSFGSAESPRDFMRTRDATNSFLPLLELAGPDSSTKKEEEIFGIDMGSEIELRNGISPPGLTADVKRDLANTMVDVVALPGGYHGGNEEDSGGNDMALLGAAMQELVHQGRTTTENSMKSDLNWRSSKRTSLKELRSLEGLRKRIKVLLKLRTKVTKSMMRAVRNSCKRGGWLDQGQVEAWAQGGHYTRIVRDTMDWYLSLHQHLMGLATTEAPWSYVQIEIDHHVEEMEVIRNTQDSRLQALCSLYAYLRDGQASNWHSTSLQYKRNVEIYARSTGDTMSISSDSLGAGSASFVGCSHCGTTLHLGGKDKCPWGYLQPVKARKEGNKALRCLAGDCEWDKGAAKDEQGRPKDKK